MSRFLKLMSILAIVALIAVPAFAEVQNVKVSGDIDSKMISRNNYDFRKSISDKDTWFNTITRVQVDADLTDNVSTVVRLLNERDWNTEPLPSAGGSGDTSIALDLANVKLKEMFYAPLTLVIGRQNLRFGSGLVVGDPDTNSTSVNAANIKSPDLSARKSFDAIRATLDYNPLTVDIITSKIAATIVATANVRNDQDLYGINAAYKFCRYNSEAEAYLFERNIRQGTANLRTDTTYVWGVRGSIEPISKLVVNGEVALQTGEFTMAPLTSGQKMDRRAWAADLGASYAIDYKWSPKVALNYTYRSGQKTPSGNTGDVDTANGVKYKAWDRMFKDQTHGIVANAIFNGNNDGVDSNSQIINVMASVVPLQDLTFAIDYYHFLLAEAWNTTNYTGVNPVRTLSGGTYAIRHNKNLGDEFDLSLAYDYTEDVKLGLTAGLFLPGATFLKDNNTMANEVIADVKVAF